MLIQESENAQPGVENGVDELCKLFEGGKISRTTFQRHGRLISRSRCTSQNFAPQCKGRSLLSF